HQEDHRQARMTGPPRRTVARAVKWPLNRFVVANVVRGMGHTRKPAAAGRALLGRGRVTVAGVVVALLVAAGCGDDAGDATGSGTQLTTQEVGGVGTVLADPDGMTLYTNEAESDGTIRCVDACVGFWPPYEGEAPTGEVPGVDGSFDDVQRPDGGRQVTLDGQPLYTFADDTSPGSAKGDGFEDDFKGDHFVWHAVTADESAPDDSGDDGGGIGGY
ncbi:MAG: COG4315 family predicted lipoprotein, partial [Nocardioidaceae bacterium]